MDIKIPFSPVGREEIHRLESILLFATLFRPEVFEMIKSSAERLTWVDSLAVAAGALAREKAKMSVREIAKELGRVEQSVRNHLKGESKAGKLVKETYALLKEGRLNEIMNFIENIGKKEKMEEEKEEKIEAERKLEKLKEELEKIQEKITKLIEGLK